jgi:hypothetical protein
LFLDEDAKGIGLYGRWEFYFNCWGGGIMLEITIFLMFFTILGVLAVVILHMNAYEESIEWTTTSFLFLGFFTEICLEHEYNKLVSDSHLAMGTTASA